MYIYNLITFLLLADVVLTDLEKLLIGVIGTLLGFIGGALLARITFRKFIEDVHKIIARIREDLTDHKKNFFDAHGINVLKERTDNIKEDVKEIKDTVRSIDLKT